jgi:hypothetical protein
MPKTVAAPAPPRHRPKQAPSAETEMPGHSSTCDAATPDFERLILFTRYPQAGTTKTRLIPALGAAGAADLQRCMTVHTLRAAIDWARRRRGDIEVRFEGGSEHLMRRWFGAPDAPRRAGDVTFLDYLPQGAGDLGERLARATQNAFHSGAHRVVVVGTDAPDLTAELLTTAFRRLGEVDVVLGPACDGGYYLIGLRRPSPQLFTNMPWGSGDVCHETQAAARAADLAVATLQTLADIDRPEDLPVWDRARNRPADPPPAISIVIPTLNEAGQIATTLLSLAGSAAEVIVADGGSGDETTAIARVHDAKVVDSMPGRARQLNAGAAAARGANLLFLHADTRLPADFERHVAETLSDPRVSAGAFRLGIDGPSRSFRLIERLVEWRSRFGQLPYGDQALFMHAERFRAVRGFPDLPIMEDVALVRRLRRYGRIAIVPAAVVTSARRWRERGVWRTTFINQACLWGYFLGVSPRRLAGWYRARPT